MIKKFVTWQLSAYIRLMIFMAIIAVIFSFYFGVVNFNVSLNRNVKLKIMDAFSDVRLNLLTVEHENYIKIPYSDILEEGAGTRWVNGVRAYRASEIAIVVVDVHESLLHMPNINKDELSIFVKRLNMFLKKSSSLGIKVIDYHSPWEGNSSLASLERSVGDINILSVQDEQRIRDEIKKYKLIMLVGTAGDKCVLTRPLGLIELNRMGLQTIYLHDLMIFFGSVGNRPQFSASDFIINLVALNWGYVGTAELFLEINK